MSVSSHAELAERFSALHRTGEPLLLPYLSSGASAAVEAFSAIAPAR